MKFKALGVRLTLVGVLFCFLSGGSASAQGVGVNESLEFRLDEPNKHLDIVINTTRIITLDKEIPRALVADTDIVSATPISPTQIQLHAKRAGITQVNIWDEDGNLYTVDVAAMGDARELDMILKRLFPQAAVRVRPLNSSVMLVGRVDTPESVNKIVQIAQDYYPKVINAITVGGVQQILLHVKVMEVSRTKLRSMGVDWANFGNTDNISQSVSGLIAAVDPTAQSVTTSAGETLSFGLIGQGNSFFLALEALAEGNLAKILAEPKLLTVSGRPASFNAGGEFPILVPQSLGTIGVEYKQFGTRVDFVPIVLGHGNIRLEVRPQVSELDAANGVTISGERIPALKTRWVDTAVEMRAGQTLALAGLIQTRIESQRRGIPFLSDLPWAGVAFRRVQEQANEIELVVTVRPELVDALDPHQVPECGPGQRTTSPSDSELYFRGYLEVPNCCNDGSCSSCQQQGVYHSEELLPNTFEVPTEATPNLEPTSIDQARRVPRTKQTRGARIDRVAKNPQRRQNRQIQTADQPVNPPGLFGGVGYDVLDLNESGQ